MFYLNNQVRNDLHNNNNNDYRFSILLNCFVIYFRIEFDLIFNHKYRYICTVHR